MFTKILVPVDGSVHSKKAIGFATDLQKIHNSEIIFLNVYRHHSLREQSMSMVRPVDPEPNDRSQRAYAEEITVWAKEEAKALGVENTRGIVRSGQPSRTIVKAAKDSGADLIVIGSRGLGDVRGFLLGSVSHKVTSLSEIPVLVV